MTIVNSLQRELNTKEWILLDEELNYASFSNSSDKDYILYFGLYGELLVMGILDIESGSDDLYQATVCCKDKSKNQITQEFLENIKTGEIKITTYQPTE
jgi:hypothetical protein